ncbi:MAG: ATP-binding cassette domain-containing protein [Desulfopila sp.]
MTGLAFLDHGPYSLDVARGECIGLSGRSGIGKTQLLRAIADLIPHSGTVRLDGVSAEEMEPPSWRCQVGMVPADSVWWHDLVGSHFHQRQPAMDVVALLGLGLRSVETHLVAKPYRERVCG